MTYEEAVQLWGRKALTDRGYKVADTELVSVELTTADYGSCDTCSYVVSVVEIKTGKSSITIEDYEFSRMLNELVAVVAENADRINNTV